MEFHENYSLEKFWIDWFGYGRELGSNEPHSFGTCPKGYEKSHRMFTSDVSLFLKFIEWCNQNKHACWITSQPMREYGMPLGIEKLFFDFDYPLGKNEVMTQKKRGKVKEKILSFVESLDFEPLIVATNKGYHAYIFLRRIYEFEPKNVEFAKEVYGTLSLSMLGMSKVYAQLEDDDRAKWKYVDFDCSGDIMRMARVPLSLHEKTGVQCKILNRKLEETKIRSLDLYRAYGLREDKIRDAVEVVKEYHKQKLVKEWRRVNSGTKDFQTNGNCFNGQMRPCFTERLKIGEMVHQQRLALLMEAWWSGHKTEEQLLEVCKNFKDYNESISRGQIKFFFEHEVWKIPPYQCDTLQRYGYCLKDECEIYRKRHNHT